MNIIAIRLVRKLPGGLRMTLDAARPSSSRDATAALARAHLHVLLLFSLAVGFVMLGALLVDVVSTGVAVPRR